MRAIEAFRDLVPETGVIGVMSSELASVANNRIGTWEVYRASKGGAEHPDEELRRPPPRRPPRPGAHGPPAGSAPTWRGPAALYSVEENIPKVVDVLIAAAGKSGLRFVDFNGADVAW